MASGHCIVVSIPERGRLEEARCPCEKNFREPCLLMCVSGMGHQVLLGHVIPVFVVFGCQENFLFMCQLCLGMSLVVSFLEFNTCSVILFFLLRTLDSLRVLDRKKSAFSSQKCGSEQQSPGIQARTVKINEDKLCSGDVQGGRETSLIRPSVVNLELGKFLQN